MCFKCLDFCWLELKKYVLAVIYVYFDNLPFYWVSKLGLVENGHDIQCYYWKQCVVAKSCLSNNTWIKYVILMQIRMQEKRKTHFLMWNKGIVMWHVYVKCHVCFSLCVGWAPETVWAQMVCCPYERVDGPGGRLRPLRPDMDNV